MKNEDMECLTNRIREKIGDENVALISDELGLLITDTVNVNTELENKDKQIEKLKDDKDNLLTTNSKLFQQVSQALDVKAINENKDEKEQKKFSFKDCFDKKGNFI